ncbi:MAG: response regulator transcription factor [Oscillospiraceae bacterium]
MRILIVEDEIGLAEGIKAVLEPKGYVADIVNDGLSGLDYALSNIYDAIILDIMLPKLDGLDVLKHLRMEKVTTPVLLLTAKSEVSDRIRGLDCGADDYLTKPFDTGELLARLRALTRRRGELMDDVLSFCDIQLNRSTMALSCGQGTMKLGQKEFQVMEILLINARQIVSKDILCEKVWGPDDMCEYNNVEVYISFLRKKLAHLHSCVTIKAVRGVGYTLEVSGR